MPFKPLTKSDLADALRGLATKNDLARLASRGDLERVQEQLGRSVRDLNLAVTRQLGDVARRLEQVEGRLLVVETKLEAIMAELATRHEVRRLVRALRHQESSSTRPTSSSPNPHSP